MIELECDNLQPCFICENSLTHYGHHGFELIYPLCFYVNKECERYGFPPEFVGLMMHLQILQRGICFARYCKKCMRNSILANTAYPVKTPCCQSVMQDCDVLNILDKKDHAWFGQLRNKGYQIANENLYPCYAPQCTASVDRKNADSLNKVVCSRCDSNNCLSCYAIHEDGMTCEQWKQENSFLQEAREDNKKRNQEMIEKNLGMYCPGCDIFITFDGGCDGITCTNCRHQICRITKQSRWGPEGHGDISGGCKCGVGGVLCHPGCRCCH